MNNLKILIVEDESIMAMELQESIEALGYKVVDYATNCDMAFEIMQDSDVNLILMDINLRDRLNGIELYRAFETNIPIIYITAYKDDETISQAVETNPIGYLVKPHNDNELNAILRLAKFKMQQNQLQELPNDNAVILGDGYLFNTKEERLFYGKHHIKLSFNELKLLKLLILHSHPLITRPADQSPVPDKFQAVC